MPLGFSTAAQTRFLVLLLFLVLLGGCASVPDDLGLADVEDAVRERASIELGEGALFDGGRLTLATAEHLALANDARRRALLGRLGLAAAELAAAGRVRNPVLSIADLSGSGGAEDELVLGITASLASLLTLPGRRAVADERFAMHQDEAAAGLLDLAAETRRHFFAYVEHRLALEVRERMHATGQATLELARRFEAAGNMSPRNLSEVELRVGEFELERLAAEIEVARARATLANELGLRFEDPWHVAAALSDLPADEADVEGLVHLAEQGLHLAAKKRQLELAARGQGIANVEAWLDDAELGFEREREGDGSGRRGPHAALALPVFGPEQQHTLRASATLSLARAEYDAQRLSTANRVRAQHAAVAAARGSVEHLKGALLPAAERALDAAQREQNFMLIGVFELLDLRQDVYALQGAYLSALADYWQARADLSLAVGRSLEPISGRPLVTVDAVVGCSPETQADPDHHPHHHTHHEARP